MSTRKLSLRSTQQGLAVGHLATGLMAFALTGPLGFLAWHYPPGAGLALALVLGISTLTYLFPHAWALWIPAALPLIGWAPWTGWLTFEEIDLVVLAVAVGGYARLALAPLASAKKTVRKPTSRLDRLLAWVFFALCAISVAVATLRGLAITGTWGFGWYQGYTEPMNALRVGKSLYWALLLLPLWRSAPCSPAWSLGMTLGLISTGLITIWERVAYTGLLNFSTDYRTTALFWEMNVGGAALDGFLALTVPFALRQALLARTLAQRGVAGTALVLGMYACLTTFSRGVYAAIPVGVALMLFLHYRQARRSQDPTLTPSNAKGANPQTSGLIVVGCFTVAGTWVFSSSGYRGAFAVFGAISALCLLSNLLRRARGSVWIGGLGLGSLLSAVAITAAWAAPKSSYVLFALALLACLGIAYLEHQRYSKSAADGKRRPRSSLALLGLASYCAAVTGMVLVMQHWGDMPALTAGLPVVLALVLALVYLGSAKRRVLPRSLQWHGTVAGGMLMALTVVGVFSGGSYLSDRFSTVEADLTGRVAHWQQGLSMLGKGGGWLWGRGMGSYPATYLMEGPHEERVGDYRAITDNTGPRLLMSGGLHVLTDGKLLRISQRIGVPDLPLVMSVDVKTTTGVGIRFEVCPKHLLYSDFNCVSETLETQSTANQWQHFEVKLRGDNPNRGDWFAPKFIAFSMAITRSGSIAEVRNLQLHDGAGHEVLANGDFSEGLHHWFISSDRNHLPWHIKNLLMNVLFEQGLVGLVVFLGLTGTALWRVTAGSARDHPLAPTIAAAIAGFHAVGFFDSLLDVPRDAFLYYFLVLLAVNLRYAAPSLSPPNRNQ
jgi:hypothetical protein